MAGVKLYQGDCLEILPTLAENSVDTVITDPPGGIAFMGAKWDNKSSYEPCTEKGIAVKSAFSELLQPWEVGFLAFIVDYAVMTLRVAKPGAMNLTWAIPRTSDLTKMGLRLAGWEIRNTIYYLFGSGFPKSANILKQMDRAAGKEREIVGHDPARYRQDNDNNNVYAAHCGQTGNITAPATDAAKLWSGWGTSLKPAAEEWILAMKPRDGTFAHNAMVHGVAGLAIDAARIPTGDGLTIHNSGKRGIYGGVALHEAKTHTGPTHQGAGQHKGRWPANLILSHSPGCKKVGTKKVKGDKRGATGGVITHAYDGKGIYGKGLHKENGRTPAYGDADGTETIAEYDCTEDCPVAMLDEQSGISKSVQQSNSEPSDYSGFGPGDSRPNFRWHKRGVSHNDSGGASRYFLNLPPDEQATRFFYCAKASRRERNAGLEGMEKKYPATMGDGIGAREHNPKEAGAWTQNHHPTIKPLKLMEYLCTLTQTPTGGIVLDPFMGSGTTGIACVNTGRDFIGIELERDYFEIAQARIEHAQKQIVQLKLQREEKR